MEKTKFNTVLDDNTQRMSEIERFKAQPISTKAQTIAILGLSVGAAIMASLFVFQILTGIFAIIMAGVCTAALWFGWKFIKNADPVIQQKTKNYVLKKMVEEARKNSIYQLDNQVLARHQKLKEAKTARDKMGALVAGLLDKVRDTPPSSTSYAKMSDILARIEVSYQTVIESIDTATRSNQEFEQKVKEFKDLDAFTKLAGEAMALFEDDSSGKLQEMLSLEAFKHIDSEFNLALITIENSARDMEAQK